MYHNPQTKSQEGNENDMLQDQLTNSSLQKDSITNLKENNEFIFNEKLVFIHDNYELKLEENNEDQSMVFNPFENKDVVHNFSPLGITNSHEGTPIYFPVIHNMVVSFESFQEHLLRNNWFKDMEPGEAFTNEGYSYLFDDQKVIIHGFKDPFVILLESLVKEKFVLFINTGLGFRLEFELPFLKFF